MKPVKFKGTNNTTITLSFKTITNLFYKPVLSNSEKEISIPLLLDILQVGRTQKKLKDLKDIEYDFNLLRNIVAGACSMSMKRQ